MTSDADDIWDAALGRLRRKQGYVPLTPAEADAAYDEASALPLPPGRIEEIVKAVTAGAAGGRNEATPSEWGDWSRGFPLREMRRLQFSLPADVSDADALLDFFGVTSPDGWRATWEASPIAFRQTKVFDARQEAVTAWVREAELTAGKLTLAEYDETRLRAVLGELRRLTRRRTDEALTRAQEVCSQVGLAVVLVAELSGTRISGCARWLAGGHPMVGLTLRYKTDDQLWFTFFHEVGHILLHRGRRSFVVDNAAEDMGDGVIDPEMAEYEAEADRFAADTLIPAAELQAFVRRRVFTNESIHALAEALGVGPGVVVGRLQHDGVLKHHQGNKLKQKLAWGFKTEG